MREIWPPNAPLYYAWLHRAASIISKTIFIIPTHAHYAYRPFEQARVRTPAQQADMPP
jgi:hypothetical protein